MEEKCPGPFYASQSQHGNLPNIDDPPRNLMTIPIPPAAYDFLATEKAVGDDRSILRRLELLGLKVKHCDPPAEEIVDGPGVAADLPEYRAGPCKACKFWKQRSKLWPSGSSGSASTRARSAFRFAVWNVCRSSVLNCSSIGP